jgi:hypothetical protein
MTRLVTSSARKAFVAQISGGVPGHLDRLIPVLA